MRIFLLLILVFRVYANESAMPFELTGLYNALFACLNSRNSEQQFLNCIFKDSPPKEIQSDIFREIARAPENYSGLDVLISVVRLINTKEVEKPQIDLKKQRAIIDYFEQQIKIAPRVGKGPLRIGANTGFSFVETYKALTLCPGNVDIMKDILVVRSYDMVANIARGFNSDSFKNLDPNQKKEIRSLLEGFSFYEGDKFDYLLYQDLPSKLSKYLQNGGLIYDFVKKRKQFTDTKTMHYTNLKTLGLFDC